MISCRQLAELLADSASPGQVPSEHQESVEQHLRRCPCCAAYLESYHLTIRLAGQLPRAPLPPGLAQQLRALLQAGSPPEGGERQSNPDPAGLGP